MSLPSLKRLDRAIDLLRALLEEDNRYSLRVKGKHPLEYAWLLKREEELEYYRNIFNRINSDPKLRHRVIFDPAGDDINDWFTMVGFILSPSDFESFHMAVGEGILTGATPVVWERDGASEIWSSRFVAKDTDDAKRMVLNGMVDDVQEFESFERYLPSSVSREWSSILMRRAG